MIFKWVRSFGAFWYDFVVGDDWLLAVGVIVALGGTALLAHVAKVPSWWLLPIAVLGVVAVSTLRAGRNARRAGRAAPSPAQAVPATDQPAEPH
jgi:hypothetical protein